MTKLNKPTISVVMPVFNCADFVLKAIHSTLEQSAGDFELLIIDDRSTDNSWELISSIDDPRIKRFQNETNLGYLKTVNLAFEMCVGEFVTFQDADDWSEVNRFEKLLEAFDQDAELSVCGSQCIFIGRGKSSISEYPLSYQQIKADLRKGENAVFCGASLMVRQEVLDEIGPYNEGFDRIGSEDLDWYLRIASKLKVINISDPLYYYRKTTGSVTQKLNLNPLKYHSSDFAMKLNNLHHAELKTTGERSSKLEELKQECLGVYQKDVSRIYFVAGLHQLGAGNTSSYFWCCNKILKLTGPSIKLLFYIMSFFPGLLFSFLNERSKKKAFRFIKKVKHSRSE